ncbi:hypothetical protein SAMN05192534_101482 [Alteribacillus persepolensis]|uniref:Uncharacterized protein n=1 Tax=Alteribacillus persepolensis TaxID=568899 RepID=A0A1G7ZBJ9_9BACI|nr:hypothetical protein [Alteribacillus persepolensis]SDH06068.1 hypothetical protein SAMN05192534_101482 [Alteribacillus persepolensis]
MNKWFIALIAVLALAFVPSHAFASVNAWNDAEPMFITAFSILSVITLIFFIYLMLRDNG